MDKKIIASNDYYLVAKGGLEGAADTWIKIEGSIKVEVSDDEHKMPLRIIADNELNFSGFGQLKEELSKDPWKFIVGNSNINYDKWVKVKDYVRDANERQVFLEKYKSFVKNEPIGEPEYILDFPSNTISYHRRRENGTIIKSTVSVFDKDNRLLFQSSGDGCFEGDKPFGNNHGAYFMIPEKNYRVEISNDGNNGLGDESWIMAEIIRQDELSPAPYYDFGTPERIEVGERKIFDFKTENVKKDKSGLIKINNISR